MSNVRPIFSNVRGQVERQAGKQIVQAMRDRTPTLIGINKALRKLKCTLKNPLEWNDCDNTSFYIPNRNWYVTGLTCQNYNALIIISKGKMLGMDREGGKHHAVHIRRYWDFLFGEDGWERKEVQEAAEKGLALEWAIKKADWLQQYASDQYKGNPYPTRQTLQHYIDAKFDPHTWGDHGYVYSDEPYAVAQGIVRRLVELDCIMIDAEGTLQELTERMEEE